MDVTAFSQLFVCWLFFVQAQEAERERRCKVFCEVRFLEQDEQKQENV